MNYTNMAKKIIAEVVKTDYSNVRAYRIDKGGQIVAGWSLFPYQGFLFDFGQSRCWSGEASPKVMHATRMPFDEVSLADPDYLTKLRAKGERRFGLSHETLRQKK